MSGSLNWNTAALVAELAVCQIPDSEAEIAAESSQGRLREVRSCKGMCMLVGCM